MYPILIIYMLTDTKKFITFENFLLMGWLRNLARYVGYVVNPVGAVVDYINGKNVSPTEPGNDNTNYTSDLAQTVDYAVSDVWNDVTGQTQIEQQNQANMDLAKYQAQMNEEFYNKYSSPEALMRQYQEAGLNPNLAYSGASSGQGNVPSYSAPSINRKLSKFEQLQKALSVLTGVMNIQNLMYNTAASREIAEQNGVKTLGLVEDVLAKRRNNAVNGLMVGYQPSLGMKNLFDKSVFGRMKSGVDAYQGLSNLDQYSSAMRSQKINQAYKTLMSNAYEFGNYFDINGDVQSFKPYENWFANSIWRNEVLEYDAKVRRFGYDWDKEYKTLMKSMGVASPILQVLTRLLGGYSKL